MNSLLHLLGTFGQILQSQLFPRLKEELGEISEHHEQFVRALALLEMEGVCSSATWAGPSGA